MGSMATPQRIKDVLANKASENFAGRREELASLLDCLDEGRALVTWVHGIAGVGKSALLAEFRTRAEAAGAHAVLIDCRFIEPTPEGFQRALRGFAEGAPAKRKVLILDSYESFLLLDAWLRQSFIPELGEPVRIVLASRFPPGAQWLLSLEWQGLFRALHLREMPDADAISLLKRSGIGPREAERLNRLARGNPLALRLAASTAPLRSGEGLEDAATRAIISKLAGYYLDGVVDQESRTLVEAASVVYRFTRSLARAMVPDAPPQAFDRLTASCLVEAARDGLVLHDAVRGVIASSLQSSDPHRFQAYRKAAWIQLRAEARSASREQMWGYTSGMIFLLANPVVREAFFPSRSLPVNVERAGPADGAVIKDITCRQETPAAALLVECWWKRAPETFRAVRDSVGATTGFYILAELRDQGLPQMDEDPVMRAWRRHLRANPLSPEQTAVFLRRWLSAADGELPSAVQAACWLDAKRSYMELRPRLRRCYLSVCGLDVYGPTAKGLGFEIIEGASVILDGITHHLAVLDFGPGSVDGWLTGLVAAELGVKEEGLLDLESRELVLEEQRVALTSLEFELLRYLQERGGKAVGRAELLEQIWRRRPDSSSNVADVVVRSLRKKMGSRAARLATVRGFGYRLDPDR